jgi:TRAP-type C4-dicarboxylate transport system permease small subunit
MAEEENRDDDGKAASPWPSARRSEAPAGKGAKAAWAAPLDRLDRAWTRLDARLCAFVLLSEVVTLVFWISIKSLSMTGKGGPGQVWRSLFSALVLGLVAWRVTKKRMGDGTERQAVTTVATILGFIAGRHWGDAGAEYFANVQAWLQNASILVFFGGVAEIAKRLTLWLALLGASVATGQGKHINVDIVMRFLGPRARVPVAVLGWLTAAIVSATAAWGFFDNIAVEDFRVRADRGVTASQKIDAVLKDTDRNLFLARRQLSLDVRSLPKVIGGTPYAKWMTASEWNAWLRGGGWEQHFAAEDVKALELPEDGATFRNPAVTAVPGGTEVVTKLLVPLLNMVFPFGLLVIAIRFLLRSILAVTGWVKVDPDAAHSDDELVHAHEHPEARS